MTPYQKRVADYDDERREAFKRIHDTYEKPRRRTQEMLKWRRENPSPRAHKEQADNLKRALRETEKSTAPQ